MVVDLIGTLRFSCKQIAIMQEGPNWNWQDYTMLEQIWYYNTLQDANFLLCHNQSDVNYYNGLTGKNTYVMPSLMIEDTLWKGQMALSESQYEQDSMNRIMGTGCAQCTRYIHHCFISCRRFK